jgi:hypothetical protein
MRLISLISASRWIGGLALDQWTFCGHSLDCLRLLRSRSDQPEISRFRAFACAGPLIRREASPTNQRKFRRLDCVFAGRPPNERERHSLSFTQDRWTPSIDFQHIWLTLIQWNISKSVEFYPGSLETCERDGRRRMEDQIDTLDVHDRREMRAIWGAESTHPGSTVQSIKDRSPANRGRFGEKSDASERRPAI